VDVVGTEIIPQDCHGIGSANAARSVYKLGPAAKDAVPELVDALKSAVEKIPPRITDEVCASSALSQKYYAAARIWKRRTCGILDCYRGALPWPLPGSLDFLVCFDALAKTAPSGRQLASFCITRARAGNARKSVASPSAIVGWARIASRNAV
jgi:hypothetical protein